MLYSKQSNSRLGNQQRTFATGRKGFIPSQRGGTWGESDGVPMTAMDTPKGQPPRNAKDALMVGAIGGEGEGQGAPGASSGKTGPGTTAEQRSVDMTTGFLGSLKDQMATGALAGITNPAAVRALGPLGAMQYGGFAPLGPGALGMNVTDSVLGYGLSEARSKAFDMAIDAAFASEDTAKGLQLSSEKQAMDESMGNKGLIGQTMTALGLVGQSLVSPFSERGFQTPGQISASKHDKQKIQAATEHLASFQMNELDAFNEMGTPSAAAAAAAAAAENDAKTGAKKSLMDSFSLPSFMDMATSLSNAAVAGHKKAIEGYSPGQKAQSALMDGIAQSYGQAFADDVNAAMSPSLSLNKLGMLDPKAWEMARQIEAGKDPTFSGPDAARMGKIRGIAESLVNPETWGLVEGVEQEAFGRKAAEETAEETVDNMAKGIESQHRAEIVSKVDAVEQGLLDRGLFGGDPDPSDHAGPNSGESTGPASAADAAAAAADAAGAAASANAGGWGGGWGGGDGGWGDGEGGGGGYGR